MHSNQLLCAMFRNSLLLSFFNLITHDKAGNREEKWGLQESSVAESEIKQVSEDLGVASIEFI